jgi:leucyl aminopeptidase
VRMQVLAGSALQRYGLVRAVAQGAGENSARVIELRLGCGAGGADVPSRPTVCLAGKGVVYDTGGLELKSKGAMYGMHGDKAGASVAFGVLLHFAARLRLRLRLQHGPARARTRARTRPRTSRGGSAGDGAEDGAEDGAGAGAGAGAGTTGLPFNLVAVLPMVENAVSEAAMRPGDVVRAYDGNTVEIVNPDAEGRLILADALASCARFDPAYVIDLATLTGTAASVLSDLACAFYTKTEPLAALVRAAGDAVGERAWRMPPWDEYAERCGSAVATYKNSGYDASGGGGGDGFMAAMFLHNFVPETARAAWIHLDLSHVDVPGTPYMTGTGLLLTLEIVDRLAALVTAAPT